MLNIFRAVSINNVYFCCTLIAFSLSTLPAYTVPQITVNDAAFVLKMGKNC